MTNRRDPITKAMIFHWAKKSTMSHPDSFHAGFYYWMVLGAYEGLRKSEWLQDAFDFKKKKYFMRNIDGSVKTFLKSEFDFRDAKNLRISPDARGIIRDAY